MEEPVYIQTISNKSTFNVDQNLFKAFSSAQEY